MHRTAFLCSLYLVKMILAVGIYGTCYQSSLSAMEDGTIYSRVAPETYRIRMEARVKPGKNEVLVYLPLPENTPAQRIDTMQHSEGEIYAVPGSPGEKRLKVVVGPDAPKVGETVFVDFNTTLWCYKVDFDRISIIHPYDSESELYQKYTREELPYFDLNHGKVVEAVDEIAAATRDNLDFARRAYFHVLETIRFNGKKHLAPVPLADVLEAGQGSSFHAGNYYVSLLRRRGIPARNVFALNASGEERRWQEFYLQGYGWIPVAIDLVQKYAEPSNFFGMAIPPPFWKDRQPHCIVLGYTVAGDLPGAEGAQPITKFLSGAKILATGGRTDKQRLIVEKIEPTGE